MGESMKSMTREEIFATLQGILCETFELEPAQVTAEANLFDDLGLDSIDAVDLAIKLQQLTGKRVNAEVFKSVRTVDDVVNTVHQMIEAA
jgi:acyl carrier protein